MSNSNSIPIAQMLIEATDGGSLAKLASAVAAFANKPQKIKLGMDFQNFDPSKMGMFIASLSRTMNSGLKTQLQLLKSDKNALAQALGDPKKAADSFANNVVSAMSASLISPQMKATLSQVAGALSANLFADLQQSIAKDANKAAAGIAKSMGAIIKHGTPLQRAQYAASGVAVKSAAAGADPYKTEAANRQVVADMIKQQHAILVAQGKSQWIALKAAKADALSFVKSNIAIVSDPEKFVKNAAAPVRRTIRDAEIAAKQSQESARQAASDRQAKGGKPSSKYGVDIRKAKEDFQTESASAHTEQERKAAESRFRDRQRVILRSFTASTEKDLKSVGSDALSSARGARKEGFSFAREHSIPAADAREAFSEVRNRERLAREAAARKSSATSATSAPVLDPAAQKAAQDKKDQDKKDAADAKAKDMAQRERLRQLSPGALKKRYASETFGKSGEAALNAALNLDDVVGKEIQKAVENTALSQRVKTEKALRQSYHTSRRSYTDPRHQLVPESDLEGNADYAEGIMGSRTGQRIGTKQILDRAAAFRKQRTEELDRIDAELRKNPNNPSASQLRIDRAYATVDLAKNEAATAKILALHKEDEQILQRIEKGYGSGLYGQLKKKLDADALLTNQRKRESIANPKQSSLESAHNLNFAAMNAAYGFQDFFQVLAQPGMGVSRAFLAAANNIGPALGVLAGSAVGANVAVGVLLAGMAGLNMVMGKDEEKLKGVKDSVDRLADAYKRLHSQTISFERGSRPSGISTGQKAVGALQNELLNSPQNADPLRNMMDLNSVKTETARNRDRVKPGFWRGVGTEASGIPNWGIFDLERGALGGLGMSSKKDFPTDEKEALCPDIQSFEKEGIKSPLPSGKDAYPKGSAGWQLERISLEGQERRRFNAMKEEVNAERATQKEKGGFADQYMAEMQMHKQKMSGFKNLDKEADTKADDLVNAYQKTQSYGRRFGATGREKGLVKGAFDRIIDASDLLQQSSAELESVEKSQIDSDHLNRLNSRRKSLEGYSEIDEKTGDETVYQGLIGAASESGDGTLESRLKAELINVNAAIKPFTNQLKEARQAVVSYQKQMDKSGEAFDLLMQEIGGGKTAASMLIPGLDKSGLFASEERRSAVNVGVNGIRDKYDAMHPDDRRSFDARSKNLQFGDEFASSMAKIEEIKTDLISFRETNFSQAPGSEENRAVADALDMGKALGVNLESVDMAMKRSAREADSLRKSLDDLAKFTPGAKGSVERMKHLLNASVLEKGQQAVANDPLNQAQNATNKFFIELENLNKAIERGGELSEASGNKFTKQEGRILKLNEAISRLGFDESLNKQLSDFDAMGKQIVETMKSENVDPDKIREFEAKSKYKRGEKVFNSPDERAGRANVGGNFEQGLFGRRTGRQVNLAERAAALKKQMQKDLEDNDLGEAGSRSLREKYRKDLISEAASFAGQGGIGKTSIIDSASLSQRIQESLTSSPAMQVEERQVTLLQGILDQLKAGRNVPTEKIEGALGGFDSGGYAGGGKKPSHRDVIPAMLRAGEAVVTPEIQADIAEALGMNPFSLFGGTGSDGLRSRMSRGKSFHEWARFGQVPGFDEGGIVGSVGVDPSVPAQREAAMNRLREMALPSGFATPSRISSGRGDSPFMDQMSSAQKRILNAGRNPERQSLWQKQAYGELDPEMPGESGRKTWFEKLSKEERKELMHSRGQGAMLDFGMFPLHVMDTPMAMGRAGLAGKNPFSLNTLLPQSSKRTYGRGVLESWGAVGPNEPGMDWGDAGGLGIDMASLSLAGLARSGAKSIANAPARAAQRELLRSTGGTRHAAESFAASLAKDIEKSGIRATSKIRTNARNTTDLAESSQMPKTYIETEYHRGDTFLGTTKHTLDKNANLTLKQVTTVGNTGLLRPLYGAESSFAKRTGASVSSSTINPKTAAKFNEFYPGHQATAGFMKKWTPKEHDPSKFFDQFLPKKSFGERVIGGLGIAKNKFSELSDDFLPPSSKGEAFGAFSKERIKAMVETRRKGTVYKDVQKNPDAFYNGQEIIGTSEPLITGRAVGYGRKSAEQGGYVYGSPAAENAKKSVMEMLEEIEKGNAGGMFSPASNSAVIPPRSVSGRSLRSHSDILRHENNHLMNWNADTANRHLPLSMRLISLASRSDSPAIRGFANIADEISSFSTARGTKDGFDAFLHPSGFYKSQFSEAGVPNLAISAYERAAKLYSRSKVVNQEHRLRYKELSDFGKKFNGKETRPVSDYESLNPKQLEEFWRLKEIAKQEQIAQQKISIKKPTGFSPEGHDSGGMAGSGKKPSSRDVIPALLRKGERVYTPEEQKEIEAKQVPGFRFSAMLNPEFRKWQMKQDALKAHQNRQMGRQEHEFGSADRKSEHSVQSGRLGMSGFYRHQGQKGSSGSGRLLYGSATNKSPWPNGYPTISTQGPMSKDELADFGLNKTPAGFRLGEHSKLGFGYGRASDAMLSAQGKLEAEAKISEYRGQGTSDASGAANDLEMKKMEGLGFSRKAQEAQARMHARQMADKVRPEDQKAAQQEYRSSLLAKGGANAAPAFDKKQAYLDKRSAGWSKEEAEKFSEEAAERAKNPVGPTSSTVRGKTRTNSWMEKSKFGQREDDSSGLSPEKKYKLDDLEAMQRDIPRYSVKGGDRGKRWRDGVADDNKMEKEGSKLNMDAQLEKIDAWPTSIPKFADDRMKGIGVNTGTGAMLKDAKRGKGYMNKEMDIDVPGKQKQKSFDDILDQRVVPQNLTGDQQASRGGSFSSGSEQGMSSALLKQAVDLLTKMVDVSGEHSSNIVDAVRDSGISIG